MNSVFSRKAVLTKSGRILLASVLLFFLTGVWQILIGINDNQYFRALAKEIRRSAVEDSSFALASMKHIHIEVLKKPQNQDLPYLDLFYQTFLNGCRNKTYLIYHTGWLDSPCSEVSRVLIILLDAGGVKSHRIRSGGHTLVEVFFDGKWHLFDPTFNYVWRKDSGEIASFVEVKADTTLLFRIRKDHPDFKYVFNEDFRMAWKRFPLPVIKHILLLFYTEDELVSWNTPYWMMRPPMIGALISFSLSALLLLVFSVIVYRKARKRS
ncbi:MAG: hypothetical protein JXA60_03310 [Candidatus Coatesbacteria bacterium]|nr:hypothetical protein [Candidatus Coatesbacteria bacterium]